MLLLLGKNYVTISNDIFDVEVEVVISDMTTTYVDPNQVYSYMGSSLASVGWRTLLETCTKLLF